MAARSTWAGALTFAGFNINLKAYNTTKSRSSDSFKTLCKCHGLPIVAPRTCATDGVQLDPGSLAKGVEVKKGTYHALDDATVEAINSAQRSVVIEPRQFAPVDSLPLHLATGSYAIVADSDVAGAEKPVAIMTAALEALDMALVTEWVPRAGSRDSILVIRARHGELIANTLPYETELNVGLPIPTPVAVSDAERQMFEQAMTTLYTVGPFEFSNFTSAYKDRRDKAVAAALLGNPMPESAAPAAPSAPDLMAALQASLNAARTEA